MKTYTEIQNAQIGTLIQEFTEQAVAFYDGMKEQPVCRPAKEATLEHLEKQTIPAEGRPVQEVYSEMLRDIYSNTILGQHPRSFSCVPSTASLLSWMGDVMTGFYNPHASCQVNGPAAEMVEKKLINWMCSLAGYPKTSGGLFVSGGSMANLTALTAARDQKLTYEERSRAVIYVSGQTHASVAKGLHIIGFRKDQIHVIPVDSLFRMDITTLRVAILNDREEGRIPFAVIASAGTTNTGSVDPMHDIAALCKEFDMRMHVDGAFGASVLLSEKYREKLSGIEYSDSMSWDAHKWMLQTYSCSAVLVRKESTLVHSFAAHPEYLKDAQSSADSVEFWDLGPELTRPARSLKLWLTLQAMGTDAMEKIIDHGCALAQLAQRLISQSPDWEIVSPAQLGIINFRYISHRQLSPRELDRINQNISRKITKSGFAQIYTTELNGQKVLRMCTINPRTTEKDICDTVNLLKQLASDKNAEAVFGAKGQKEERYWHSA